MWPDLKRWSKAWWAGSRRSARRVADEQTGQSTSWGSSEGRSGELVLFQSARRSGSHVGHRYTTRIDWMDSWVPRDLSTMDCNAVRTSALPHVGQVGFRSRTHERAHDPQVTVIVCWPGLPSRCPDRSSSSPQPGQIRSSTLFTLGPASGAPVTIADSTVGLAGDRSRRPLPHARGTD